MAGRLRVRPQPKGEQGPVASLRPRGQVDPVDKEDEVRHDQER
jgi:hypothetical protein